MKYFIEFCVFTASLLSAVTGITYGNLKFNDPVLLLAARQNFGKYTGEILKAEGFNEFKIDSISNPAFSLQYLQKFDILILTQYDISDKQQILISEYVKLGGNLIAFRPDKKLYHLLGLGSKPDPFKDGYIKVNTDTKEGKGITGETLQFHGEADQCILMSGQIIASFYDSYQRPLDLPAIAAGNYGKGHTVAFLYNLPESIVLTRQGNPQNAGMEKDGIPGIRAMDMFTHGWLDTKKNTINQADEQMRLLSHCIENINRENKPLPRFWYFPGALNSLITITNDGEDSRGEHIQKQVMDIESKGAKMSLYILQPGKVTKESVDSWVNAGHEVSGHPDDTHEASQPLWINMSLALHDKKNEIFTKYGLGMHTVVNHWFVWCGRNENEIQEFAAQAMIESRNGIEMDLNYAHYDNNSNQVHFLGPRGADQGNFTGSGLAMKFADSNGNILDIYQLLTNVYDQQYMEHKDAYDFYNCFKSLLDRSINEEIYSTISIKVHNNEYYFSKEPLMKMLDYANEKNIPVWTAAELLSFLKVKEEASFTDIYWSDKQLSFKVKSALKGNAELSFLVPGSFINTILKSILIDGNNIVYNHKTIKGRDYVLVSVAPGKSYDVKVIYR